MYIHHFLFICVLNVVFYRISISTSFFPSSAKESLPPIEPGWFTEGAFSNMNNVDLDITSGKRHGK